MADWARVDLGEAVLTGLEKGHYDGVVAYGHLDGRPYAAVIDSDSGVTTLRLPGSGPVTWVAVSEAIEVAVDGDPPLYLYGELGDGFRVSPDVDATDLVRLWPVCGDEDPQVIVLDRTGRLRVVDVAIGDPPEGDGLWVDAADPRSARLLAGQASVSPFVAGPLRGGDRAPGEQLWVCDPDDGWQQVELDPPPDRFTEIYSGFWPVFAGHSALRPVAFGEGGSRLECPEIPLDPHHPQVSVADSGPWSLMLALQTSESGPQLWKDSGTGWRMELLPPGRLVTAREHGSSQVAVVIDGQLWQGSDLWTGSR